MVVDIEKAQCRHCHRGASFLMQVWSPRVHFMHTNRCSPICASDAYAFQTARSTESGREVARAVDARRQLACTHTDSTCRQSLFYVGPYMFPNSSIPPETHLLWTLRVRHNVAALDLQHIFLNLHTQQRANHALLLLAAPQVRITHGKEGHWVHPHRDWAAAGGQQDLLRCHA